MPHAPRNPGSGGATLVRWLARLTDAPSPGAALTEPGSPLSQWLGWTDAIALSTALNGAPPSVPAAARTDVDIEARECERVHAALAKTIQDDRPRAAPRGQTPSWVARAQALSAPDETDYATHRQRYLQLQQSMENELALLRARLRNQLAARSPEQARLAVVDAVLEKVLGARERNLLATLPTLFEKHFRQCKAAAGEAGGEPGAWLDGFRRDMRQLLLAELEVRFQPMDGLLAALRADAPAATPA